VPIYEFLCERCGTRFEGLVDAGTEEAACRSCGAEGARRIYSAHGAPFKLVKTPGEMRKQERSNAQLRDRTKKRFAERRGRAGRSGGGEA
jgi:putative FmdB family regulatory protein